MFWKSPFAPASEVGRVLHQLCKASLCAEPSTTRYRPRQYERAAELGGETRDRSRCHHAAREARRVNANRTADSVDDRDRVKIVARAVRCLSLAERMCAAMPKEAKWSPLSSTVDVALLGPAAIASGCCRMGQSVTFQKKLSVKSLSFYENEAVWKRTEVYS